MSAARLPIPPLDELLKLAPQHSSLASLARALGVKPDTLVNRLHNEGTSDEVKAALKTRRLAAVPTAPGEEVSEVEILQQRVRELESASRATRKQDIRDERIVRAFEEALVDVKPKYRPRARSKLRKGVEEKHEHVLLLSDLHANERVSFEETLGLNAYDWAVMTDRLERIRHAVLSFQEHRPYPIERLHVFMLGDMVSGTIHDELAETNEMPHEHSVVQLGWDLGKWLEEFLPHYREIKVTGVVGNHPRRKRKPQAKRSTDNSDWTVYEFIRAYHRKTEGLEIIVPNSSYAIATVAERWRGFLMHGDGGGRSTMVGVPFGKILRHAQKLEPQLQWAGKAVDFFACGHWHQMNALGVGPRTRLFVNGSVKGVDEWVLKTFGGGDPPQQLLITAHPDRGLTDSSYIDCVDVVPNAVALAGVAA